MAAITEACHASEASSYCPGTGCGTTNDTLIKYPFRLLGEAANDKCYTYFTELQFACFNEILYLNITPHLEFSYQVVKIDYVKQTLDVRPVWNSSCRPFNPNDFHPLNVSGTLAFPLDCSANTSTTCYSKPSASSNSSCPDNHGRYRCPFQQENQAATYTNNSCYLSEGNATKLELEWQGSSSSMFQNLIYHIIGLYCGFVLGYESYLSVLDYVALNQTCQKGICQILDCLKEVVMGVVIILFVIL